MLSVCPRSDLSRSSWDRLLSSGWTGLLCLWDPACVLARSQLANWMFILIYDFSCHWLGLRVAFSECVSAGFRILVCWSKKKMCCLSSSSIFDTTPNVRRAYFGIHICREDGAGISAGTASVGRLFQFLLDSDGGRRL